MQSILTINVREITKIIHPTKIAVTFKATANGDVDNSMTKAERERLRLNLLYESHS